MLSVDNYIGIDVSKGWFDAALISKKQPSISKFKFDNNEQGIKEFRKSLRAKNVLLNKKTLVVLEHSGLYQRELVKFFQTKKSLLCVENALRIKKSLGILRGKNDSLDSERIADYARRNLDKLVLWKEPRKPVVILKDLLTNRARMLKVQGALHVPLKEMKGIHNRNYLRIFKKINNDVLAGIKCSVEAINFEIDRVVKSDKALSKQVELLRSVPGVGKILSTYLICCTQEFSKCQAGKQLAAYAGVVPYKYTSGLSTTTPGHVSRQSNRTLNAYLFLAVASTIRANSKCEFKIYYDRKVAEGKHKMLVINNIKNKILLRVVSVIKRQEPYEPSYNPKKVVEN